MADDQNPHSVTHDAKEEVVGKALQVDTTKVARADRERLGSFRSLLHEHPQLAVKVVRKFGRGDLLVILHDLENIGVNLRMQDKLHQLRRALTN